MFGKGVKLFTLFGFQIRMDWSWLIIAILLTWSLAGGVFPHYFRGLSPGAYWWMGVAGTLGLFISVVLHELGHSLVARRFGVPMRSITLFIFGGVAQMGKEPPSPKAEFFTAVGGPIVTVLLVGLFFALTVLSGATQWPATVAGVLAYLAWINLVVLVFNMIPAFPLDGGRVLRSALWAWKKNLRWATRIASNLGAFFGLLLIVWGIFTFVSGNFVGGMWYFLIGLFIRSASHSSYQQVLLEEMLAGEPIRHFMTPNPVTVPPQASVQTIVENYLYHYPYRFYPVVDHEHLLGCISVDQVKTIPREKWDERTAESVAAPCSRDNIIDAEADAAKAFSAMARNGTRRLMVVDHGQLVGVVALKDLLTFFSRKMELERA
jgi:Zn-dependent protease/predicted transcriptional regulator